MLGVYALPRFICHASEDKTDFVPPLAKKLLERGKPAFAVERGVIVTAAHNLGGTVRLFDRKGELFAENVDFKPHPQWDPDSGRGPDVAVARVKFGDLHVPTWRIRHEPVQTQEEVAALGFASIPWFEAPLALYRGLVESESSNYMSRLRAIQVSIEIAGGMSGGPVIDRGGELVGIVMESTFLQIAPAGSSDEAAIGKHTAARADTAVGVERAFRHVLPVGYVSEALEA